MWTLVESIGARNESTRTVVRRAVGQIQVERRMNGKYKGYHGHLMEFGTTIRETKSGANRGNVTPHKFVEPAFNQSSGQVENRINNSIGRKLSAFMKQKIKRAS